MRMNYHVSARLRTDQIHVITQAASARLSEILRCKADVLLLFSYLDVLVSHYGKSPPHRNNQNFSTFSVAHEGTIGFKAGLIVDSPHMPLLVYLNTTAANPICTGCAIEHFRSTDAHAPVSEEFYTRLATLQHDLLLALNDDLLPIDFSLGWPLG